MLPLEELKDNEEFLITRLHPELAILAVASDAKIGLKCVEAYNNLGVSTKLLDFAHERGASISNLETLGFDLVLWRQKAAGKPPDPTKSEM
jgi:hypothetical protein